MNRDAKTQIRIEGWPESDQLIRELLEFSAKMGLKPTTAARSLIRRGLDAVKEEEPLWRK